MTDLSPAAQAVLDAAEIGLDGYIELLPPTWKPSVAAALRAAADQVVPPEQETPWGSIVQSHAAVLSIRNELLAIAAELEAQ